MIENVKTTYPVVPLKNLVVYPNTIVPVFLGRSMSIKAIQESQNDRIILLTQKDSSVETPKSSDLRKVGVIAKVLQILKLQNSSIKILVEGVSRVKVSKIENVDGKLEASCKILRDEENSDAEETQALRALIDEQFKEYSVSTEKIAEDIPQNISSIQSDVNFADAIAAHISATVDEKQQILEETSLNKRLTHILTHLQRMVSLMALKNRISTRVARQLKEKQKNSALQEHLSALLKEMGMDEAQDEILEFRKKIDSTKMPAEVKQKLEEELKRLKILGPHSNEANIVRDYIRLALQLPWKKSGTINKNISEAKKVLDSDHYGLADIKDRILEHIAVVIKTKKPQSTILCLAGPPGVGKTSLAESIAKATGRKFTKISLGGLRDEAEIRGHRKTYIGAMPGKIIQALKKVGVNNPVILLDEIDKLASDHRGDPASALLEALDPEQNKNFNDHYMEVDMDLSNVMFIATANYIHDIPVPLLDRLELIDVAGYTEEEKLEISTKHLINKLMKETGLKSKDFSITKDAIKEAIRYYTRESGVRSLQRVIGKIMRKVVKQNLNKKDAHAKITVSNLSKYLGPKKYTYGEVSHDDMVGVTNGLAYNSVGGDLLTIEAVTSPHGKGEIKITGKLGDIMKESAQAALSYIKSNCYRYGIHPNVFNKQDIHLHVPEGATPKEGPSAGIAIATSIISVLTGVAVHKDVAMTGEITLRGRVLPIGGLKEKLLAALRGGVKKALIPIGNKKDIAELPKKLVNSLEIKPVESFDEVIEETLITPLKSIPQDDSFLLSNNSAVQLENTTTSH